VHLEKVHDAFYPADLAQDFLRDLLVIKRVDAAVKNHDPFVVSPRNFVAQEMWAALERVIDANLQFVSRYTWEIYGSRRNLRNRHGSTFN